MLLRSERRLRLSRVQVKLALCLRLALRFVTEFETRKTVQTESRTKPIGLSLAEVQPVFGETKATKQIAHYDTPP